MFLQMVIYYREAFLSIKSLVDGKIKCKARYVIGGHGEK